MKRKKLTDKQKLRTARKEIRRLKRLAKWFEVEAEGNQALLEAANRTIHKMRESIKLSRKYSVFNALAELQTRGRLVCFSGVMSQRPQPTGEAVAEMRTERDAEMVLRVLKEIGIVYGNWMLEQKGRKCRVF